MLTLDRIDQAIIDETTHKISRIPRLAPEQAEEATMEGLLALSERADRFEDRDRDALKGLLYTFARFRALSIREKAMKHQTDSLDSMIEQVDETGTGRRALGEALSDERFSLDAHLELADLNADPVMALRLAAVAQGASARIMKRGAAHPAARYSDEQVRRVRELAAAKVPHGDIGVLTGISKGYVTGLARRTARVCESTEGWDREMALAAFKRFAEREGRVPLHRDGVAPLMPPATTVRRLFGKWNNAVLAAGMTPREDKGRAWTAQEIAQALFAWRKGHGRWPRANEVNEDKSLPTMQTIWRHWHTRRIGVVVELAMAEMFAMLENVVEGSSPARQTAGAPY